MAEKEIYHLDVVIDVKGDEETKSKLSAMDKFIEKTEKRAKILDKMQMSPAARIEDKITGPAKKIDSVLNKMNKSKVNVKTKLSDKVSSPARRITSTLKKIKDTAWTATVKIKDKASSILGKIKNGCGSLFSALTSVQSMILGVGGTWAGVVKPMQIAGDFEQTQIAFTTMLHSAKKANTFLSQAQNMANKTPFDFPGLADASKQMLAFQWDVKKILPDLTIIGDTAAGLGLGTDGIQRITLALGQMKAKGTVAGQELLQLTEAGVPATKILQEQLGLTSKQVQNIGKQGISSDKAINALLIGMNKRFGGMMQQQSETALGLMSTLKDTFENKLVKEWGAGLWGGVKPTLSKVTHWLDKNDDKVTALGRTFKKAGENISKWIVGGLDKTGKRINDLVNSSAWKNASTLGGKIKLSWDEIIAKPFSEWWNGNGKKKINKVAGNIGKSLGSTVGGAISTILGAFTNTGNDSSIVTAGTTAGQSFLNAFIKAFDVNKILNKLKQAFKDANLDAIKKPSAASITKAGILDYGLYSLGGGLLLKGAGKAAKGGFNAYKWLRYGSTGAKAAGAAGTAAEAASDIAEGTSGISKIADAFGKIGPVAKKIPVIGTVAAIAGAGLAIGIAKNKKRTAAKVSGNLIGAAAGTKAGALAGGAIGSLAGPAGTAVGAGIGAVAGGIGGAIGGEKAATKIYDKTGPALKRIKTDFNGAKKSVQTSWKNVGNWFGTNVSTPLSTNFNNAKKSIESKWSNTKSWFGDKIGTPLKDGAINAINFTVGAFSLGKEAASKAWAPYGAWFNSHVSTPVKNGAKATGTWISQKYSQAKQGVSNTWASFSGWWGTNISSPVKSAASSVGSWISQKYSQAKQGASNAWINFSGWWGTNVATPVKGAASDVGSWIGQRFNTAKDNAHIAWVGFSGWWSKNIASPVKTAATDVGTWIGDKFSAARKAVEGTWSDFSTWFKNHIGGPAYALLEKIMKTGQEKTGLTVGKVRPKANGGITQGPEFSLIGEAGPEAIIPLSDNRKNRGLSLWQQAGRMLGVRMFANGGIVGNTSEDKTLSSIANISVNIVIDGNVSNSISKIIDNCDIILKNFSQRTHVYGQNIINDLVQGVQTSASNLTNIVKTLTNKVVNGFKTGFGIHSPSKVMFKIGNYLMQGLVNGMSLKDVSTFISKQIGNITNAAGGTISGNVSGWLSTALAMTDTSMSWLPGLEKLSSRESGNNPLAINTQAVGNEHATGLLQTLPSTFRQFMQKGMNNILNPVHNAAAAINYIKSRYGSIYNTPLFKGGSYAGYAMGTKNAAKGAHPVAEHGFEIITGRQFKGFNGGEKVYAHDDSKNILKSLEPRYYTSQPQIAVSNGCGPINIDVNNDLRNETDINKIVDQATKAFAVRLKQELLTIKR